MPNTNPDHAGHLDGADNRWEIMARLYFEKLTALLAELEFGDEVKAELTVKH